MQSAPDGDSSYAADRLLQRFGVPGEIAVGAGGERIGDGGLVGGFARGPYALRRQLDVEQRFARLAGVVVDVAADDPDLDRLADGLGNVLRPRPIAALEIGADGDVDGTGDPPDAVIISCRPSRPS